MIYYRIALFLHIVGALGLFVGLGLEWMSVRQLRRAFTGGEAIGWIRPLGSLRRLYPASMAAILASGLYMTAAGWGRVWWAVFGLIGMVLIAAIGRGLAGGRMSAVRRATFEEGGPLSPASRALLRDPVLWGSVQARVALALGIVFLMSVKPGLTGSLATLAVASLAGIAASTRAWGRRSESDSTVTGAGSHKQPLLAKD